MHSFFVSVGSVFLALSVEVQAQAADFTLQAQTVEALEGGPVVLRVTLIYQGKEPVAVNPASLLSPPPVYVEAPNGWNAIEPVITIVDGDGIGLPGFIGDGDGVSEGTKSQTMKRGDRVSGTAFVHKGFTRIPSGRASVKVIWEVDRYLREKCGTIGVATPLVLDVRPATKQNLAALRKRIEATLARPRLQAAEKQELSQWIVGTRHPALLPPALRMIASGDDAYPLDRLIDFCYSLDEIPQEVHERLLELAADPAWGGRMTLFRVWGARHVSLPSSQFRKLLESKNIWTRLLTAVTFPRQCDKVWTDALVRNLHDLSQSLPSDQFARLLRDLDNDTFAVRENAMAQLTTYGERVETQLKQALRTNLAAEAKRRVRFLLAGIAAKQKTPEWKPILDYLSSRNGDRDAAIAVLRALATGNPDAALTKAAVASLDKLTAPK